MESNAMKSNLLAAALLISAPALATAQGLSFCVQVKNGTINFANTKIVEEISPKVIGIVTNDSPYHYKQIAFKVLFFDKQNREIENLSSIKPSFTLRELAPKKTATIGKYEGSFATPRLTTTPARYEIQLDNYEIQVDYKISLVSPAASSALEFSDESLSVQWIFDKKFLAFTLQNKASSAIKIDWNQVSYIDPAGNVHKVIHNGVRFIDMDRPHQPTYILPTAKITDQILSANAVQYEREYTYRGTAGKWRQDPMFWDGDDMIKLKGSKFSVYMLFEIDGKLKPYTFTFQIDDVVF
jgi:hypothetical protein